MFGTLLPLVLGSILTLLVSGSSGKCGVSKVDPRIVGGKYASKHAFPWQVGLFWRVGLSKGQQFCGGTLIHPQYVVSAAHCFMNGKNPAYYQVRLGDHVISDTDGKEEIRNISKLFVHEQYHEITYDNDIALIKLERPVILNDNINTICLPRPFDDVYQVKSKCIITGWGATGFGGASSDILMEAYVPVVRREQCTHEDVYGSKISENMFCAGYANGSQDTCGGDSGGPFQCRKPGSNQFVLRGVTSWGQGCGKKLKYGVYTLVKNYWAWLKLTIMHADRVTPAPPIPPPIPPIPPPMPPMPTKNPIRSLRPPPPIHKKKRKTSRKARN